MAPIKLGADNKRNVVIVAVLLAVVAYLAITQIFSGPSRPVVTAPTPQGAPQHPRRAAANLKESSPAESGQAHKLPSIGLDPTLHLERLAASESIEYAGTGRNIFSMDSTPMRVETALASARPRQQAAAAAYTAPPAPRPPTIDLKYFGYSVASNGTRRAFLLHGEDIFDAGVGEIVDHRFKVISIAPTGIQITDLGYNNTQTLPLESN